MQPNNLANDLAQIDILIRHLGWAQSFVGRGAYLHWRIHEPEKIWKAVKDAVLATDGPKAVARLAEGAKHQDKDQRLGWMRRGLSEKAITLLAMELERQRQLHPTPAGLPPLKAEEIDEPVCFVCGASNPPLRCDGKVHGGGTCDRPLCKSCAKSQSFIACRRGKGGGAVAGSKDYCPDCAVTEVRHG